MSDHNVLVMGLPKAGKTTFLAALWDVVETEKISGSLILESVEGDVQHLNAIRELWANCEEIPRTRLGQEKIVSMALRDRESDAKGRLCFPDMDGEMFGRQWTDRTWPRSHKQITEISDSALLFVHPAKVKASALIRDTKRAMAALTEGVAAPVDVEEAGPPREPSEKSTPTQVQLIELLQFVDWVKQGLSDFRLGFIISAWDVIMKQSATTPDKWLQSHLPMLYQFLTANRESIRLRVYGVSAQGGDIVKEAERLRGNHSPSERIIIAEGSSRSSDITIPVRWVMGMNEE